MTAQISLAFQGAWKVLFVSLLLGAGLPLLFAAGIRSLAFGEGGAAVESGPGERARGNPLGRVLAAICFLVVLFGIVTGIMIVVAAGFGKVVSFEHVFPILVPKS